MTDDLSFLTATQKGAIAENLVANRIIIESDGQLAPFVPVADDDGLDMLVYDKKSGKVLPIQIKSRMKTLRRSPKVVHFEVRKATLKQGRRGAVLAVLLSEDMKNVLQAWFIPMRDLPTIAKETATKYVMRMSSDCSSKDKYSPYRCGSIGEVAARLKELLLA